jgi:hypothetical protein
MTAARFLADLRGRGAIVAVVADRLRVDAPVGVVTAADRAALVEHKAELLALLGSSIARVERVEFDLQSAGQANFLSVQRHVHVCTTCSTTFSCTAPSCSGQPKRCVCCTLGPIGGRSRR